MKIYELPRYEAAQLVKRKTCTMLYEVPELMTTTYGTDTKKYKFRVLDGTEPLFPSYINNLVVENSASFWNFAGDATHGSELFYTPNDWIVGTKIMIENKYNVPPTKAMVSDVKLIRGPNLVTWFWSITLTTE